MKKKSDLVQKVPPQSDEAERAVLGAMLIDKEAVSQASEILQGKHFYKNTHRGIYEVMIKLYLESRAIDFITVSDALKGENVLDGVGGPAYLTELINSVSTAANIEYYAKIVSEKAVLRELINISTNIVNDCYEEKEEIEKILDKAESSIFSIAKFKIKIGFVPISELIHDAIDTVESLYNKKEHITGLETGFTEFDSWTSGLQPSNLIIIAGRPSMGKTSLCLNIATHAAINNKQSVAVFSLEMSRTELMNRLLCSEARVNSHDVRRGYLSKKYWTALTNAASHLSEASLFIDDSSTLSVLEMRTRARRLAAELAVEGKKLSLIMIDYLQLMEGSSNKFESRQQQVSEISRALKGLARELEVPVIALSQLSRKPEEKGREGKPQLSDLRESGSLEQDADLVAFIYREEVYKKDNPDLYNKAKLIIAKQRNGPIGEINLTFLKEYTRFENPAKEADAVV